MVDAEALFRETVGIIVIGLEGAAAFVILVGALRALARFLYREALLALGGEHDPPRRHIRSEFGRSLLLGLDFAIGSDVLKVAIAPTYEQVLITGLVVLVRTILTFVLEYEISRDQREAEREANPPK